jgi:hypothetical protein
MRLSCFLNHEIHEKSLGSTPFACGEWTLTNQPMSLLKGLLLALSLPVGELAEAWFDKLRGQPLRTSLSE